MVEVRTDHDIFLFELRITAGENAHDILRFHLRTSHSNPRLDLHRQRKVWQRLICIERRKNLLKGVAAPGKKHFSVRGIE